jgi:hypothetical protein
MLFLRPNPVIVEDFEPALGVLRPISIGRLALFWRSDSGLRIAKIVRPSRDRIGDESQSIISVDLGALLEIFG